jgi:MFS family permease
MYPIKKELKIKLFALSLVFPLSLSVSGFFVGYYEYNLTIAYILGFTGLITGILLDIVCFYRKLFTVVLYQTPIPMALLLISWWISSTFMNDLKALLFAVGGLIIGLWLNKELVIPFQFYKIKKRVLAVIYVFFSINVLGYFMGIPVFNLLLGFLAGNYLSIRVMSNYKVEREITKNFKTGALYTSFILLLITLLAWFMAMSDIDNSIQTANEVLKTSLSRDKFVLLITTGGILIVIIQYFITYYTAKTMLQLWKHKRFSKYMVKG